MDKIGRWDICSINPFFNIPAIEATKFESLEARPDDVDESLLKTWDQLLVLAPALGNLFKKVHTTRGQIELANALRKISRSGLSARFTKVLHIRLVSLFPRSKNGMYQMAISTIKTSTMKSSTILKSFLKMSNPSRYQSIGTRKYSATKMAWLAVKTTTSMYQTTERMPENTVPTTSMARTARKARNAKRATVRV
ncbi:hypothetical protein C8R42DRAFT_638948 [Lentinula raphanica]|nr:hypothetical protein C8R42DRAFT_638948 [Lentinula raphanica]